MAHVFFWRLGFGQAGVLLGLLTGHHPVAFLVSGAIFDSVVVPTKPSFLAALLSFSPCADIDPSEVPPKKHKPSMAVLVKLKNLRVVRLAQAAVLHESFARDPVASG